MEKQEIKSLKQMIVNWKDSYIKLAEDNGNENMYLLDDFLEEIELYLPNYMCRLVDIEYITVEEFIEFRKFLNDEIDDLKRALGI